MLVALLQPSSVAGTPGHWNLALRPKRERGTRRVFEEEKWDNFHFWMLMSESQVARWKEGETC